MPYARWDEPWTAGADCEEAGAQAVGQGRRGAPGRGDRPRRAGAAGFVDDERRAGSHACFRHRASARGRHRHQFPRRVATQSEYIAERIRQLASEKGVRVLAFCEDVVASGGYWIACAADEIYAAHTSLVGSIGVVSSGFGFVDVLGRLGVERRLYSAGENKVRLDSFSPEKADDVEWLQGLQHQLHDTFIRWVRQRRGKRLAADDEVLFTGDVWIGERAAELGLVDASGSCDRWWPSTIPTRDHRRRRPQTVARADRRGSGPGIGGRRGVDRRRVSALERASAVRLR